MTIVTRVEMLDATKEILSSKASIRGLFLDRYTLDEVEKLVNRFNECYEWLKRIESDKAATFEAQKAEVRAIQDMLKEKGISIETFNSFVNMSKSTVTKDKAERKPRKTTEQKVYVLEYSVDGVTHRTPLMGLRGRKSADLAAYITGLGLNPYATEDCLQFAVNPTEEEVAAFTGNPDLIVYPESGEE